MTGGAEERSGPEPGIPHRPRRAPIALVPGGAPIPLPACYPQFADYYLRAEAQTRRWFASNLEPDWTFVDVGANIGVYTILAARTITEGLVVAIEPTTTVEMLRENLRANDVRRVVVLEHALSDRGGTRTEAIYRV